MTLQGLHRRIIAQDAAPWAAPLRAGLAVLSWVYGLVVRRRNRKYDRRGPAYRPPVPVISVGNLTTGGTGKTPCVIEIVQRLVRMGRRPVVLARGYRAEAGGFNDEHRILQRRCPGIVCLCDPDRTRSAKQAVEEHGADVLVLDDGFQHRRLARDLDIVLIDATCPFGYGHLLPRGLLREPVSSLRRADLLVITRADQVAPAALQALQRRIHELSPQSPMITAAHRIAGWAHADGSPAVPLVHGARAVAFAGIGNPAAFFATLESAGIEIVERHALADHARYTPRDLDRLIARQKATAADWLVTTEKDAVKIVTLDPDRLPDVRVLHVDVHLLEGGAILDRRLKQVLTSKGV